MKADEIRITKYGIRKGDYYCPCVYTPNNDGSVTVYARRYDRHIPRELGEIRNGTDVSSDYFEADSCRVYEGNPYYETLCKKSRGE